MSVQFSDSVHELFKKYYYDPKIGILSAPKFYYRLKVELGEQNFKNLKITLKQVQDFIKLQQVAQTFHQRRVRKRDEYPIRAPFGPFSKMMIDLLDVRNYKKSNDNIEYILTCVDVYTRYAFAEPMKSKTLVEILPKVKAIMNDPIVTENKPKKPEGDNKEHIKAPYVLFVGDNEPAWAKGAFKPYDEDNKNNNNDEIQDTKFKDYFRRNNIQLRLVKNDLKKKSLVETFNKTLRNRIQTLMASNEGRYIDGLKDILYSYNNNLHQTIKVTPTMAIKDNRIYDEILYKRVKKLDNKDALEPLKEGDYVRTWVGKKHIDDNKKDNDRGTFAKADQVWKPTIRKVVTVNKDHTYMITGYKTPFRRSELLKVPVDSAGEPISITDNPNFNYYAHRKKQDEEKQTETSLRGEEIYDSDLEINEATKVNVIPIALQPGRRVSSRVQASARRDQESVGEIPITAQIRQQGVLLRNFKKLQKDNKRPLNAGSIKSNKKMKTENYSLFYHYSC